MSPADGALGYQETYVTGTKADLMHCPYMLQLEGQMTANRSTNETHPHRFTPNPHRNQSLASWS